MSLLVAACSSGAAPTDSPGAAAGGAGGSGGSGSGSSSTTTALASGARPTSFPGADWETVDPVAAGFDPQKLADLSAKAEAGGSNCLLIARDGKLVGEWYYNGKTAETAQEVYSATKSYTSTLVGIAQADGKLKIDDSASKYIPEWAGTPAEVVKVKDLLSNDSGRHQDQQTDYVAMAAQAPDKTAFSIALEQDHQPGETWVYNNSAIQTLSAVLKKSTGEDAAAYAKERLLDPIGMSHSEIRHDRAGNTLTFMGLQSTCRDMARYGLLAYNKGTWNGKSIVPAPYLAEATGGPSQPINSAYGYLWWLNHKGTVIGPTQAVTGVEAAAMPESQLVKGAPDDVFFALGLGGQIITVFPDTGVVAVRLAPMRAPAGSTGFSTGDLTLGAQEALVKP